MKERMPFTPENIPLPSVPFPSERVVDSGVLATAAHEVNHWVVGEYCGERVQEVSVVPTGEYQGVTIFEAPPRSERFKIIAAAGAVPTSVGPPEGYGADIGSIAIMDITEEANVDSIGPSKREASRIISRQLRPVLKKMAEIVAWFGKVPGLLYQKLKERAEFELKLEERPNTFPKKGIIFDEKCQS